MNKKELIDAMAIRTGSSKADADRAVGALIETISDTLKKGDSVSLVGFGSFEARERAARIVPLARRMASMVALKLHAIR